jgi:hypothetical protein
LLPTGEANVTFKRVKGTQDCGGIPLPLKAYRFIPTVRQKKYVGEPSFKEHHLFSVKMKVSLSLIVRLVL